MDARQIGISSSPRPLAWVLVALSLIAIALAIRWMEPPSVQTNASQPTPSVTAPGLLDRGAERLPAPSPRIGGPGGQLGDATPGN